MAGVQYLRSIALFFVFFFTHRSVCLVRTLFMFWVLTLESLSYVTFPNSLQPAFLEFYATFACTAPLKTSEPGGQKPLWFFLFFLGFGFEGFVGYGFFFFCFFAGFVFWFSCAGFFFLFFLLFCLLFWFFVCFFFFFLFCFLFFFGVFLCFPLLLCLLQPLPLQCVRNILGFFPLPSSDVFPTKQHLPRFLRAKFFSIRPLPGASFFQVCPRHAPSHVSLFPPVHFCTLFLFFLFFLKLFFFEPSTPEEFVSQRLTCARSVPSQPIPLQAPARFFFVPSPFPLPRSALSRFTPSFLLFLRLQLTHLRLVQTG